MENHDPRTFENVTVFAGDKFYPAVDATYRHLVWENIGQFGDPVKNTEIGRIPSWGPQFRVSFDLKINSYDFGDRGGGWTNVIAFKGNGGKSNSGKIGDRIPAIFLNKKGFLHFTNAVNGNRNYVFNFHPIELNKWYSITIEQISENGKVREKRKPLKER